MDASLDTCFVAEAEGHDLWNVGTEGSLESGFLCVFWIDQNVIVPSADVKLGKKTFAFELIELYLDIGHGVVIFDGDIVQLAIIHDLSRAQLVAAPAPHMSPITRRQSQRHTPLPR